MGATKKILTIFLILALVAGYIAANMRVSDKTRKSGTTIHSAQASGLSIFHDFVRRSAPTALSINTRAFTSAEELSAFKGLIIFAPKTIVSEREARILLEYAEAGGNLFVSFHSDENFRNLRPLLRSMYFDARPVEIKSFMNNQTWFVHPTASIPLFSAGKTYELYSKYFLSAACRDRNDLNCFVLNFAKGQGSITIISGLAPLSNALITRNSNPDVALYMRESFTPLLIDEFHHFFSDKTFGDLMLFPGFIVPACGMLILALLYFLFAHTTFYEKTPLPEAPKALARYHDFNRAVLLRSIKDGRDLGEALRLQVDFLKRLLPKDRQAVDDFARALRPPLSAKFSEEAVLRNARELLRFHKNLLERRAMLTEHFRPTVSSNSM